MAEPDSQTIDTAKVKNYLATWDAALNAYSGEVSEYTAAQDPCLMALNEQKIDQGFIESFDANFKALEAALKSVSDSLKTAVGYIEETDNDTKRHMPDDDGRGGGGGGGGGDDDEKTTEPPTDSPGVDNMDLQIAEYKKMDMSDLQGIVDALQKAAKENNLTIEQLLGNPDNAELIKKTLLGSIKSEELKKLIEEGDSEVTRKLLVDIMSGEYPEIVGIDTNTALTLSKYLENIATNNNITLTDLIGKEENVSLLKTSLGSFADVGNILKNTKSEDLISTMKDIHDGNYTDPGGKDVTGAIEIIRDHVSALAEHYNFENEEAIIDAQNYDKTLATLGQFSVFANNAATYKDANTVQLVKNILSVLKDTGNKETSS